MSTRREVRGPKRIVLIWGLVRVEAGVSVVYWGCEGAQGV